MPGRLSTASFYCGKGHFIRGLIYFTARQNSGPDSSGFAYGFMKSFVMDGLADTAAKSLPASLSVYGGPSRRISHECACFHYLSRNKKYH